MGKRLHRRRTRSLSPPLALASSRCMFALEAPPLWGSFVPCIDAEHCSRTPSVPDGCAHLHGAGGSECERCMQASRTDSWP